MSRKAEGMESRRRERSPAKGPRLRSGTVLRRGAPNAGHLPGVAPSVGQDVDRGVTAESPSISRRVRAIPTSRLKRRREFPIVSSMEWLIGALILATVGAVVRGILGLNLSPTLPGGGLVPLRSDLRTIYHPIAQEIEAHTTILGITLDDAFGEREANRQEMAWLVVSLGKGEWERLRGLVVGLLDTLANYVPTTSVVVPVRRVNADNFKSHPVRDTVGLYEFLDRVLFSSKQRFSLRLRVLSRTCMMLSKEFRRTCFEGERAQDSSPQVWNRLDLYFHDFDLIAKEALLAFRSLLACQSPEGVQRMAADLQDLLDRGVRVSVSASNE